MEVGGVEVVVEGAGVMGAVDVVMGAVDVVVGAVNVVVGAVNVVVGAAAEVDSTGLEGPIIKRLSGHRCAKPIKHMVACVSRFVF